MRLRRSKLKAGFGKAEVKKSEARYGLAREAVGRDKSNANLTRGLIRGNQPPNKPESHHHHHRSYQRLPAHNEPVCRVLKHSPDFGSCRRGP
jgi:hypothetical protein